MAKLFQGQILQGKIDSLQKELTVTGIKNIQTQSVWAEEQLDEMLNQTQRALDGNQESLIVTLRDSIPVLLNHQELHILNEEIKAIKGDF